MRELHLWSHGWQIYFTIVSFVRRQKDMFKLNPYHPCVSNQMVNGLKHFILFHVDD